MTLPSADHLEHVRQSIVNKLPEGSVLTLSITEDHTVSLDLIFIKPEHRGKAVADYALRLLTDYADRHQWVLSLVPVDGFGADVQRLRNWYYRWGFSGSNPMKRYPN